MKIKIILPKWLRKKKVKEHKNKNKEQWKTQNNQIEKKESQGWGLVNIIVSCIIILVGTSLIEPIANQVNSTSLTGASKTILDLVPLFFSFAILTSAIYLVYNRLKYARVI